MRESEQQRKEIKGILKSWMRSLDEWVVRSENLKKFNVLG